jgi:AmmeMemoRadiSam system protein B
LRELFCLTDKDFETPLGVASCDKEAVLNLHEAGGPAVSDNDFVHRTEHSIEFQVIFLQHILGNSEFTIVPLLCGSAEASLPEYSRDAYLDKARPFLAALEETLNDENQETLIVAGVDLSHIGPKFGHDRPAIYLEPQSKSHDQALLDALCRGDADAFWEESIRVKDQFNVCGFSALACLLEMMPPSQGQILNYQCWHEQPTQSAVSFAAVGFVKENP